MSTSEHLWVDKERRLRWGRGKYNYLKLMYSDFLWVKPIRPGKAVALGLTALYLLRWHQGSITDTLTLTVIEKL